MAAIWNLWHGCHKLSAGCQHCYVYRTDGKHGKDSSRVEKTKNFDYPVRKDRKGEWKIKPGTLVYTCFTSDFFVEEADPWRQEAWDMIKERSDLHFFMITKRIDRLAACVPADWGAGYENVTLCCTVENQERAGYRLPIYREAPIRHKVIICEPLLSAIDLAPYLGDWVEEVVVGGESGYEARPCHYEWVLAIREQCATHKIDFTFRQTGARFVKEGKLYNINRCFQGAQARRAEINLRF